MDNAATRPPDQDQGPRVTRDEVKDLGRLRRSLTDRHVGGVAGGLARHLDVDPILIRVAFVVAVFFGGAGLLAYAGAWILVPDEGSSDQPVGLDERSRTLGLYGVAVIALLAAVGDWAGAFWFPWPAALIAIAVLWFVNRHGSGTVQRGTGYGGTVQAGTPGPAPVHEDATFDSPAFDSPAYEGTPYDTTAYGAVPPPGTPVDYARAPRTPRNPRKRGPVLFGFTIALICLAEGLLALVDVAGADVVDSAYPALALGITAAMLILGAFWGRAGGLVLVGLVAAAATGITTAASSWDEQRLSYTPFTAADVRSSYDLEEGDLVLDLSRVEDLDGLDGRTLDVDGGVGRIEVVLPDGVDVRVTADVGVGSVDVVDQYHSDGLGVSESRQLDGGIGAPDLDITIDLGVGEVVVRES